MCSKSEKSIFLLFLRMAILFRMQYSLYVYVNQLYRHRILQIFKNVEIFIH
jgi:hypothetical protein